MTVTREPLPEVLRGNPDRTEALIDASRHQWTYRAGVISFAAEDAPTEEQQAEVMDHFKQLAFAGLDPTQYDVLWVRHTHEDRVELHFCTPRLELTSGRSLNIAPPGYHDAFDSLRDVMNQRHCWVDPMELEHIQEVRDTIETPTRTFLRQNKSWLTISPWLITVTFLAGIVLMMAASLLWTLMLASSEMTELGLTRIDREDGTWLVLDSTKTRLRTCTMGGWSVTCIKIEED
jgi:hypothetical protein